MLCYSPLHKSRLCYLPLVIARICELDLRRAHVKDGSYVVNRTACKRTHNQFETGCAFQPHPRESIYASGSITDFKYDTLTNTNK